MNGIFLQKILAICLVSVYTTQRQSDPNTAVAHLGYIQCPMYQSWRNLVQGIFSVLYSYVPWNGAILQCVILLIYGSSKYNGFNSAAPKVLGDYSWDIFIDLCSICYSVLGPFRYFYFFSLYCEILDRNYPDIFICLSFC